MPDPTNATTTVNCFALPPDTKVTECVFTYQIRERLPESDESCHLIYHERIPDRLGAAIVSMIVQSKYEINLPSIPFLFVWFTGAWLATRLVELPAKNNEDLFRYSIQAQSMANLQDLAKLLKLDADA
jgi:hypothetical protein